MDCNKRDCCNTCIRIGNTVTGQPGTAASVTNSGSCCCPVLNFTIPEGERGQDGASATITIGTTTTGSPGSPASVTNSGTAQNAILNFTIPAGQNGKDGINGKDGTSATVTVGTTTTGSPGSPASVTNSGTAQNAILNFTIPAGQNGKDGINGKDGTSATVSVGTTTTGSPGSPASVTNSGTAQNAILNFTIPAGQNGKDGINGKDGTSATVSVGTTTTGSPGSPASVTNSGTAQNSILNFTIPAGQNGKTPVVTVGPTTTLKAGQPATATAIPTSDGIQIDFGIPQGKPGNNANQSFASFFNYGTLFNNGSQLPFYPVVTDITGQIVQVSQEQISLEAGYYLVSYHVSAILSDAGYMQITPFYSSTSHLELGIYFLTPEGRSTANGSNTIIIYIPEKTNFTLTYNSNVSSRDGAATLSILKLQR